MGIVKTVLIFSMRSLYLSIGPGGIGTNELVLDAQFCSRKFKAGGYIPPVCNKAIDELKAVVSLDTLDMDPPARIPLEQPFEEVGREVGRLLRMGRKEAQSGKFVNNRVLE